ncbi:MAG: hypothetical protein LBE36_13105 [Flavobacteriaceae bacterium]|jgi:hypothetical protein|nr:hypothetical protein [Flavobacteriaceae bacterium]
MRNLLIVYLLSFWTAQAQSIRDKVFNDVILIQPENVVTDGNDFLIDIPFKPQENPIIIFNNDRRIPTKLFFAKESFFPKQNTILLITPDWEYIENVAKNLPKDVTIKPVGQYKFYYIDRNNAGYKVDSLSRRIDNPHNPITMNFKKPELRDDEIKCYGTICKYSGKISDKEDEDCECYTLSDLTNQQKLLFLKEFFQFHSVIIFPEILKKNKNHKYILH